MPQRCTK